MTLADMGGEFQAEFSKEIESMGGQIKYTAPFAPTQNSQCERAGGSWKYHANALIDEYSIDFRNEAHVFWMCGMINWAVNSSVNQTGYSASQWVLGRGLKLPYDLLGNAGWLDMHTRHQEDPVFAQRLAMMASAQKSVVALRHSKALSRALNARSRAEMGVPTA